MTDDGDSIQRIRIWKCNQITRGIRGWNEVHFFHLHHHRHDMYRRTQLHHHIIESLVYHARLNYATDGTMTVLCFRILVLHVLCMLEGARLFCSGFPGLPTLQRGRTDTFMKQHVLVQGCSQTKLLATNFENDGVLYRQSVCCKDEVKRMQNELSLAMKRLTKESSSIAQHRRGAQISRNTDIAEILESGSIHSLIQRAIDDSSKENESTNRMRLSKIFL